MSPLLSDAFSRLAQAFGKERVLAYCNHHQSFANDPAPSDLVVTARSPDGLIEGFEMAGGDRFVVAVVWHPERPPLGLELFSALVRAAREHANEPESDPVR